MGKGKRSTSPAPRVAVPVRSELQQAVKDRPEVIGFDHTASKAELFERLVEIGWRESERALRERERLHVYEMYELDAERASAALVHQRLAVEGGIL